MITEEFQAVVRQVQDLMLDHLRKRRRLPTRVLAPEANRDMLAQTCLELFGTRPSPEGEKLQMCGMDLEFHDGQSFEVRQ